MVQSTGNGCLMTKGTLSRHVESAQKFLGIQRKRDLFFANETMFGDPAWELLLEIYIATEKGQYLSKADLCDSVLIPHSLAVRWISIFVEYDYVEMRIKDGQNCVCMTDNARAECRSYLEAVADA